MCSCTGAFAIYEYIALAEAYEHVFVLSVLIGLTLAVDPGFKVLFVVIIFHRECCVSRLSYVQRSIG